jgi:hypothetical protein
MSTKGIQRGMNVRDLIGTFRAYSKGSISYKQVVTKTSGKSCAVHSKSGGGKAVSAAKKAPKAKTVR